MCDRPSRADDSRALKMLCRRHSLFGWNENAAAQRFWPLWTPRVLQLLVARVSKLLRNPYAPSRTTSNNEDMRDSQPRITQPNKMAYRLAPQALAAWTIFGITSLKKAVTQSPPMVSSTRSSSVSTCSISSLAWGVRATICARDCVVSLRAICHPLYHRWRGRRDRTCISWPSRHRQAIRLMMNFD